MGSCYHHIHVENKAGNPLMNIRIRLVHKAQYWYESDTTHIGYTNNSGNCELDTSQHWPESLFYLYVNDKQENPDYEQVTLTYKTNPDVWGNATVYKHIALLTVEQSGGSGGGAEVTWSDMVSNWITENSQIVTILAIVIVIMVAVLFYYRRR